MDAQRWEALNARIGCPLERESFDQLDAAYSQEHRHYHTGQHIDECLDLFDRLGDFAQHPDEVEFALWLHDVVYVPRKRDNEVKSAEHAGELLSGTSVPQDSIDRIKRLILVTRHDESPETRDQELVLDIDLQVLGAPEHRYDEYERQIRREYGWVPGPLFRRARAEILETFLARRPLYRTGWCQTHLEAAAKANLERGLIRLR